jgi:excisionase family DNA binding protein
MSKPGDKKLQTYGEMAARLGVPVGTLYAMVHHGRIPHVRLGPRLVRFDHEVIDAWLERHSVKDNNDRVA